MPGQTGAHKTAVRLSVAQSAQVEVRPEIGSVAESIEMTGSLMPLVTESISQATVVT